METNLLQTKLYIPTLRPSLVPRPHLVAKLDEAQQSKLILLSAPAGYGKTTLITEWIDSQETAVCWLSLGEDDSDPQQFFNYLAAAVRPLLSTQSSLPQLLQSPHPLPAKSLMTTFVNDVTAVSTPFLLILDDFHAIQSTTINEAMAYLLDHMPPQMRMVISSRADPMLPLSRLRVRRELIEIRAADLRMSVEETAVFLNDLMQLTLSPADIIALEARTEGWIAGLQLAALSLEKLADTDKHQFVAAFSGDDRYILDYLLDEVLRQQPPHIQEFLLKTAVLERLAAPLCDAILGRGEDEQESRGEHPISPAPSLLNSSAILDYLERANLFLVPLDNRRGWYRYQHLFADLLTNQLQATDKALIPKLHKRASLWYEKNGYLTDAFAHAWKSEDFEYAVQLLKRHARDLLVRAELVTLVTWLGKLPSDHLSAQPQLCLYYAWAATSLLRLETAVSALKHIDHHIQSNPLSAAEVADWQGQTAVVRGLIASKNLDIPQMVALSQQGLAQLSPNNHLPRGLAISNLATAQWFFGNTAAACETIGAAIGINQEASNITEVLNLMGILAQSTFEMGQLHRTEAICRRALQLIERYPAKRPTLSVDRSRPSSGPPSAGFIYVLLGQLFREWNQLDEAVAYLQKGIEISQDQSIGNLLMLRTLLAVLQGSQGNEEEALAELAKVQQLSQSMTMTRIMEQAADIEAYIHLQRGEMTAVNQWIATTNLHPDDTPIHFHEPRYLIFAYVLIQQRRWQEAEKLLAVLQHMAQEGGRTGRFIHALILSALAHQLQGHTKRATAVLQQALSLAEPNGHIRTFLNAGQPIATLLNKIKPADDKLRAYIQTLLEAFRDCGIEGSVHPNPQSALIEPLSDRELELLGLVANGRSNRQIADELFLAIGTVKKHLSNIFGKLQVSSRTQAVARARDINLI